MNLSPEQRDEIQRLLMHELRTASAAAAERGVPPQELAGLLEERRRELQEPELQTPELQEPELQAPELQGSELQAPGSQASGAAGDDAEDLRDDPVQNLGVGEQR